MSDLFLPLPGSWLLIDHKPGSGGVKNGDGKTWERKGRPVFEVLGRSPWVCAVMCGLCSILDFSLLAHKGALKCTQVHISAKMAELCAVACEGCLKHESRPDRDRGTQINTNGTADCAENAGEDWINRVIGMSVGDNSIGVNGIALEFSADAGKGEEIRERKDFKHG